MQQTHHICIVGLGYVGLPVAVAFAKAGHTVSGYDLNKKRIGELRSGTDSTGEIDSEQLAEGSIAFSANPIVIAESRIVILAIPTPIDKFKKPDLTLLKEASRTVGKHLQKESIVVLESTVYPGTTEEICGPILEQESNLQCGEDFTLGYSPERINPGDKEHTIDKITKVVAGQDEKTTDTLCELYASIVPAGIHRAASIKMAEMAKAIENAQRDLNIAYVNEVAMLCHAIGIPTKDVLEAAGTKWNFLKFQPGLVGGHCIGVDPYYLVEKARQLGIQTNVIDAGRSINDQMGAFVAHQIHRALNGESRRILVLGLTFKPDVPDTRNSKSRDVIRALLDLEHDVEIHDPHVAVETTEKQGFTAGSLERGPYDAVVLLVPHKEYMESNSQELIGATKKGGVIYDLKSVLDREAIERSGRQHIAL